MACEGRLEAPSSALVARDGTLVPPPTCQESPHLGNLSDCSRPHPHRLETSMPIPLRKSLAAVVLVLAIAQAAYAAAPDQKSTTLPAKKFAPTGKPIDPANMDPSVKPGDDFYRYANGKWIEKNPVPASEARWGAFSELQERNSQILYDICEESAKRTDAAKGTPEQMVGDFYASFMDSNKADQLGAKPLDKIMAEIAATKTTDDVLAE